MAQPPGSFNIAAADQELAALKISLTSLIRTAPITMGNLSPDARRGTILMVLDGLYGGDRDPADMKVVASELLYMLAFEQGKDGLG